MRDAVVMKCSVFDCINASVLGDGSGRCHPREKLGKEYMGSLHHSSYNCMQIYNDFKIKSLIICLKALPSFLY